MSKELFHEMRAKGYDVDDSGQMYQEPREYNCKAKPLTKEEFESKYGSRN